MKLCQIIGYLGWFLSPTRKLIDWWKRGSKEHRGEKLRQWSLWLFFLELVGCVALSLIVTGPTNGEVTLIGCFLLLYAWSRVNEIAYAFYADALSPKKESNLTRTDRIQMAMRSYYGLAFNFALFYYFIPIESLFKECLATFWEAFYFSGVTLATLGYGDISPSHWVSRFLALYEVFTGILIVAVAIATYAGAKDDYEEVDV